MIWWYTLRNLVSDGYYYEAQIPFQIAVPDTCHTPLNCVQIKLLFFPQLEHLEANTFYLPRLFSDTTNIKKKNIFLKKVKEMHLWNIA
jgi:hypothetical protein